MRERMEKNVKKQVTYEVNYAYKPDLSSNVSIFFARFIRKVK